MDPLKARDPKPLEAKIQAEIITVLRACEWVVLETHGNMYQRGFPDLYAAHYKYGTRWIEVKRSDDPNYYSFTPAQLEWFPRLSAAKVGIWVLTGADESEIKKLWLPPNWHWYWERKMK